MTSHITNQFNHLDLIAIERQARAMQSRALLDLLVALRRGIVARFARTAAARTV